MKKAFLLIAIVGVISSCTPTNQACGSKAQHKKRSAKMRSMAPTMTNR